MGKLKIDRAELDRQVAVGLSSMFGGGILPCDLARALERLLAVLDAAHDGSTEDWCSLCDPECVQEPSWHEHNCSVAACLKDGLGKK